MTVALSRKPAECIGCINPTKAAVTETVTYGDTTWVLDFCDSCHRSFERDLYRWLRCGEVAEAPETAPWHRPELRAQEPVRLRPPRPTPAEAPPASEAEPATLRGRRPLPQAAALWRLSDHAYADRCEQRSVTPEEARWAAHRPDKDLPSKHGDRWRRVRVRGDVAVVVNPRDKVIVTVLPRVQLLSAAG